MAIERTIQAVEEAGLRYEGLLEQRVLETGDPELSRRESLFGGAPSLEVDSAEYVESRSAQLYENPEIDRKVIDQSHAEIMEEFSKVTLPSRLGNPAQFLGAQIGAVIGLKQALSNYLAKIEELEKLAEEGSRRSNPREITSGIETLEKEAAEFRNSVKQQRRNLISSGFDLSTGIGRSLNRSCDLANQYDSSLTPLIRAVKKVAELSPNPISTSLPEIPGRRDYLESNLTSLKVFLQSSSTRKDEFALEMRAAYEERGAEGIADVLRRYRGIATQNEVSDREIEDISRSLEVTLTTRYDREEGISLTKKDGTEYGAEASFGSSLIGAIDLTSAEITKRKSHVDAAREEYDRDIEFRIRDRNSGNSRPTTDQDFIEAAKRRAISHAQSAKGSTRYARQNLEVMVKSLYGTMLPDGRQIDSGEYGRFISGSFMPLADARAEAEKEERPFYSLESPEATKAIACASEYAAMLDSWRERLKANKRALELHQTSMDSGIANEGYIPDIGDPPLEALEAARAGLRDFERIPAFQSLIAKFQETQSSLVKTHKTSQVAAQKALEEQTIRKEIKATPEPKRTFAGRFSSLIGNLRLFAGNVASAVGAKEAAKGFFKAAAESGKAAGNKALVEASLRGSFREVATSTTPRESKTPRKIDPQKARDAMSAVSAQREADEREAEATRAREAILETALTPRRSVVATAIRENLEAAQKAGLDMSKIAPNSKNKAMAGYKTLFRRDSDAHFLRFNPETGDIKLFKKGTVRSSTEISDIFDEYGILREEHRELVKGLISGQTSRMQEALKEAETAKETTRVEEIAKEEIAREKPVAVATIESESTRIFEEFKRDENFSKLKTTARRDGQNQINPVTIGGNTYTLVLSPDSSGFRLFEGRTEISVNNQSTLATFEAVTKQALGSVRGKDYTLKHMSEIATKATAYDLEDHPEIELHDSKRRGFAGWKDFGKTEGSTHYARFKTDPATGEITEVKLFDRTQGRTAVEVPAFDTYGTPTVEFSAFLDRVSAPIREIDERERAAQEARRAESARVEAEVEARRVESERAAREEKIKRAEARIEAESAAAAAKLAAENQQESMAEYRTTLNSKFMPYIDNYEVYFPNSKFGEPERPFCQNADSEHYIAINKDFRSPTDLPFRLYSQDGEEVEMFGPDGNITPEAKAIVDGLFEKYPAFIKAEQEKSAEKEAKLAAIAKDRFAGLEDKILRAAGDDDIGYGEDLDPEELWVELGKDLQSKGDTETLDSVLSGVVAEHFGTKLEDARRLAGHFYGDDLDPVERDRALIDEMSGRETAEVTEFLAQKEAALTKTRENLTPEQIATATAQGFEIYDDEEVLKEEDILAFIGKEILAKERGEEVETPILDSLAAQKAAADASRESDDRKIAQDQAMTKEVLEEIKAEGPKAKPDHLTDTVTHDPEVEAVIAALRGQEPEEGIDGRHDDGATASIEGGELLEERLKSDGLVDAISTGTAEVAAEYADAKVSLTKAPTKDNLNSALSAMVGGGDALAWGTDDFRKQAETIGAKIDGNRITMPAVTVPGAKGPMRFILVLDDDGKVSETELHGGAKTMFGGDKKRDLTVGDQVKPKHVEEVGGLMTAYEKMLGVEARAPEVSHETSFVDRVTAQGHAKGAHALGARASETGMVR